MKPWGNLGVVETIYEEEDYENCSTSPSDLSPSVLSSPPTPLHSRVEAWYIYINYLFIFPPFFLFFNFNTCFLNFYLILFLGIVCYKVIGNGV